MKLSKVIALASLLSGSAAFGIRGAAERALYFSAYVLEESFENSDDFRIATGCSGTRTGLGGQPGRCTLREFVEHLWMTTNGEEEPDITKTKWDSDTVPKLSSYNLETMVKWIQNVYYQVGGKRVVIPKPGYTGNTDVSKLLTGETDYYAASEKFGTYAWRARTNYAARFGSVDPTDPDRIKFDQWDVLTKNAAQNILDWRLKDQTDTMGKTIKNTLKAKYGTTSDQISVQYNFGPETDAGNIPKRVNVVGTAVMTAANLNLPISQVTSDINSAISDASSSKAAHDHAVAIEAARKTNKVIHTGCV